jgi:hypothetical protein
VPETYGSFHKKTTHHYVSCLRRKDIARPRNEWKEEFKLGNMETDFRAFSPCERVHNKT